ncbi:alpha/beta fold hydrolase [Piscinibacter gummiphilus]|uniref:Alpha/beta fold hydrolase n=1 Tax=Piscinibacter gummiphilus TaxID=946333 RepID=A0ABZ0D0C6_9BURK|nr:alpha/beta fold hydrolase [Piscinibacter gummiphilus]WOB10191.1 alpha/beta fold hydrolase [Piscinibacter gummiphilus]
MAAFSQDIRFAKASDAPSIAYAVSGHGYPLVRAATWMSNVERDWRTAILGPTFHELSKHCTLYRYNPRGFGLSEGGGEVSLETFIADLDSVVRHAKLARFALWGATSAGSLTAIAYAARHPDRVSHLVLSAPIARGTLLRPSATHAEKERFKAFVKLVELGWDAESPAFRQVETTQMFPRASPEQIAELNELFRVAAPAPLAARTVMATGESDVSALLPRVTCPALVLHVRGAALAPVEEARFVASSLPQARFVQLEAGNYMPIEGEPAFTQMIEEFRSFLPKHQGPSDREALACLTRREREVLDLVARGLDNTGIAGQLAISEKTVRNTVSHIFDKLSVRSRAQAVVVARKAGLGD